MLQVPERATARECESPELHPNCSCCPHFLCPLVLADFYPGKSGEKIFHLPLFPPRILGPGEKLDFHLDHHNLVPSLSPVQGLLHTVCEWFWPVRKLQRGFFEPDCPELSGPAVICAEWKPLLQAKCGDAPQEVVLLLASASCSMCRT